MLFAGAASLVLPGAHALTMLLRHRPHRPSPHLAIRWIEINFMCMRTPPRSPSAHHPHPSRARGAARRRRPQLWAEGGDELLADTRQAGGSGGNSGGGGDGMADGVLYGSLPPALPQPSVLLERVRSLAHPTVTGAGDVDCGLGGAAAAAGSSPARAACRSEPADTPLEHMPRGHSVVGVGLSFALRGAAEWALAVLEQPFPRGPSLEGAGAFTTEVLQRAYPQLLWLHTAPPAVAGALWLD